MSKRVTLTAVSVSRESACADAFMRFTRFCYRNPRRGKARTSKRAVSKHLQPCVGRRIPPRAPHAASFRRLRMEFALPPTRRGHPLHARGNWSPGGRGPTAAWSVRLDGNQWLDGERKRCRGTTDTQRTAMKVTVPKQGRTAVCEIDIHPV